MLVPVIAALALSRPSSIDARPLRVPLDVRATYSPADTTLAVEVSWDLGPELDLPSVQSSQEPGGFGALPTVLFGLCSWIEIKGLTVAEVTHPFEEIPPTLETSSAEDCRCPHVGQHGGSTPTSSYRYYRFLQRGELGERTRFRLSYDLPLGQPGSECEFEPDYLHLNTRCWLPALGLSRSDDGDAQLDWQVEHRAEISVPQGWIACTAQELIGFRAHGESMIWSWKSHGPHLPALTLGKRTALSFRKDPLSGFAYVAGNDSEATDSLQTVVRDLSRVAAFFRDLTGFDPSSKPIHLIEGGRSTFAYSDNSFMTFPARFFRPQLLDEQHNHRTLAHEWGHILLSPAGPGACERRIDEGLCEYWAMRFLEHEFGREDHDSVILKQRLVASLYWSKVRPSTRGANNIVQVSNSSIENALFSFFWLDLETLIGRDRLDRALRSYLAHRPQTPLWDGGGLLTHLPSRERSMAAELYEDWSRHEPRVPDLEVVRHASGGFRIRNAGTGIAAVSQTGLGDLALGPSESPLVLRPGEDVMASSTTIGELLPTALEENYGNNVHPPAVLAVEIEDRSSTPSHPILLQAWAGVTPKWAYCVAEALVSDRESPKWQVEGLLPGPYRVTATQAGANVSYKDVLLSRGRMLVRLSLDPVEDVHLRLIPSDTMETSAPYPMSRTGAGWEAQVSLPEVSGDKPIFYYFELSPGRNSHSIVFDAKAPLLLNTIPRSAVSLTPGGEKTRLFRYSSDEMPVFWTMAPSPIISRRDEWWPGRPAE